MLRSLMLTRFRMRFMLRGIGSQDRSRNYDFSQSYSLFLFQNRHLTVRIVFRPYGRGILLLHLRLAGKKSSVKKNLKFWELLPSSIGFENTKNRVRMRNSVIQ